MREGTRNDRMGCGQFYANASHGNRGLTEAMKVGLGSIACLLMSAQPSHAYLDGGTGSMMLQLLLGGLAGLGIGLRLYWRRFLDALGIRPERTEGDRVDPESDSPITNDTRS